MGAGGRAAPGAYSALLSGRVVIFVVSAMFAIHGGVGASIEGRLRGRNPDAFYNQWPLFKFPFSYRLLLLGLFCIFLLLANRASSVCAAFHGGSRWVLLPSTSALAVSAVGSSVFGSLLFLLLRLLGGFLTFWASVDSFAIERGVSSDWGAFYA